MMELKFQTEWADKLFQPNGRRQLTKSTQIIHIIDQLERGVERLEEAARH